MTLFMFQVCHVEPSTRQVNAKIQWEPPESGSSCNLPFHFKDHGGPGLALTFLFPLFHVHHFYNFSPISLLLFFLSSIEKYSSTYKSHSVTRDIYLCLQTLNIISFSDSRHIPVPPKVKHNLTFRSTAGCRAGLCDNSSMECGDKSPSEFFHILHVWLGPVT